MQLSHPFTHTPMPKYPGVTSDEEYRHYHALDGKVRMHNLARHVAAKPTTEERQVFLSGMTKFHSPAFMDRFKKLMAHYWRRQRRHSARGATR